MEKKEIINWTILGLLIAIVLLLCVNAYIMSKDGSECLISPIAYGIDEIEQQTGAEILCSCSAANSIGRVLIGSDGVLKESLT